MITPLLFLLFWSLAAPALAARLAKLVAVEEIGRPLRDWVERRHPGTPWDYVVGCPVCLSHWASLLLVILAQAVLGPQFQFFARSFGFHGLPAHVLFLALLWGWTLELAVVLWLRE